MKILSLRKYAISFDFHFLENKHGDAKYLGYWFAG